MRHAEACLAHHVAEDKSIFGASDRIDVRADQLDAMLCKDALLGELHREVQRGLPAQGRKQRIGLLAGDHLCDRLGVERLDVGRVGPLRVGHDRRRVRVDERYPYALGPEDSARLRSRVVELACLPDPNRARADDQDALELYAPWHVSAIRSKKGSASWGPGAASG